MKKYSVFMLSLLFLASCGNSSKNKVDATDSQAVAANAGQQLAVDVAGSTIKWEGYKVGGSHHGTLKLQSGELFIQGDTLKSGSFVLDMNSIVNIDLTDAKMNEMLVGHLKSADFFDVAKYPTAEFKITAVEQVPANDSITHKISGNLKLKDADKNITFGAKITKEGDVFKAVSLPFTIDRTQWGVNYGSKSIFKDLKDKIIKDNMQVQLEIVAKAAPAAPAVQQ